ARAFQIAPSWVRPVAIDTSSEGGEIMGERASRLRSFAGAFFFAAALLFVLAGFAQGSAYTIGPRTLATGPSPFVPGCGGPGEAGPTSFNSEDTEIEPWVAVDPTD